MRWSEWPRDFPRRCVRLHASFVSKRPWCPACSPRVCFCCCLGGRGARHHAVEQKPQVGDAGAARSRAHSSSLVLVARVSVCMSRCCVRAVCVCVWSEFVCRPALTAISCAQLSAIDCGSAQAADRALCTAGDGRRRGRRGYVRRVPSLVSWLPLATVGGAPLPSGKSLYSQCTLY